MVIIIAVLAIAIVYVLHGLRVVGVFADGPRAGRMRVQGAYAPADHKTGPRVGTAVFAIPRGAVLRRHQDSLRADAQHTAVERGGLTSWPPRPKQWSCERMDAVAAASRS